MAVCVDSLIKGVQASCAAQRKVGGLDARIYVGAVDDLESVTFDGTTNAITAFTFKTDKGFVKYSGRRDKNSAGSDIEQGENVNIRTHTVSMAVYYETKDDLKALDDLIDAQKVFVVVEAVAGSLEVFGINKSNFGSFGLRMSSNPGTSGILLNDSTAFIPVLSGGFTNLQLLYNPATALADNIIALDAQTIDPASS
jgi:hypothetical protein